MIVKTNHNVKWYITITHNSGSAWPLEGNAVEWLTLVTTSLKLLELFTFAGILNATAQLNHVN